VKVRRYFLIDGSYLALFFSVIQFAYQHAFEEEVRFTLNDRLIKPVLKKLKALEAYYKVCELYIWLG